jgi:hypothetical protein
MWLSQMTITRIEHGDKIELHGFNNEGRKVVVRNLQNVVIGDPVRPKV